MEGIRFDDAGLVPAVVQDADRGAVLMVGWMNRAALRATQETGMVHFYSRSRGALWRKGETSGNGLEVVSLWADCDGDTLLVRARPQGPTCHTGEATCFFRPLPAGRGGEGSAGPVGGAAGRPGATTTSEAGRDLQLAPLLAVLEQRRRERPAGSYTVQLLDDPDRALRKLVEEAMEVALAVKNGDRANLVWELADLLYHVAVVMTVEGISLAEVNAELASREGRGGR